RGRELHLEGRRPPPPPEGRLYQQLETAHGAFRRVVELGADVVAGEAKAAYRDGVLEITLPLDRPESQRRKVRVTESRRS
ncbi:MAG TPA: Hsp20/alpha crystallin family protein, partial [Solirubrobacteraceae bacterium]|nr:Hsp20/alpha crystallin family protein [Solirubrobacteraceae bacterium]